MNKEINFTNCKIVTGRAYNGAKMLLYQGIIAYELWNDTVISDKLAEEVYEKMIKA